LQLPGEHPYCGDKLQASSGFSYLPEELFEAGVAFFNPGWRDMEVPDLPHMVNTVQLMMSVLQGGGKIAVHCHAGYGRTGVAIACVQLYRNSALMPETAISDIRSHRRKCVQTAKQQAFVGAFHQCKHYTDIQDKRVMFPAYPKGLREFLEGQAVILHGAEWKQLQFCPKAVRVICAKIKAMGGSPEVLMNALIAPSDTTAAGSLLESRIAACKAQANSAIWTDIESEENLSVLCQLLLDWFEAALLDPPLLFPSTVSQLAAEVKALPSVTYSGTLTAIVNRGKFTLLQTVAEDLLSPLADQAQGLYERAFVRVSVSLQGSKSRHKGCFTGRRLETVSEKLRQETAVAVGLLQNWGQKVV